MSDDSVRPFEPGDGPAVLEVELASFDRAPLPGVSRAEIPWTVSRMELVADGTLLAVDDGRVVGACTPRVDSLTVHPDFRRRGHGRRLVEAGRALVGRAGLDELSLWGDATRPEVAAFIRALGATYRSSLWQFVLPARRAVPAPLFPGDVVVRPIRPGIDDAPFATLLNRVFEDHPTPLSWPEAYIREIHARPDFDPAGVLMVAPTGQPDRLVGLCRTLELPGDHGRRRGEVAIVGLLPEWRGRGLGRQLLRWGVGYLRSAGFGEIELSVEARNAHALELYRQEGFEAAVEWPHWVVPAIRPGSENRPAVSPPRPPAGRAPRDTTSTAG
jgi:mycothiol synthase